MYTFKLSNYQETKIVEFLIFLSIIPLLLLKGVAAIFGTTLFVYAFFLCIKYNFSISLRPRKNIYLIYFFFLSPLIAILLSQIIRGDFEIRAYDGPLRFILAIPLFIYINNKNFDFIKVISWALPISIIIIYVVSLIPLSHFGMPIFSNDSRLTVKHLDPIIFGNYSIIFAFCCLFLITVETNKNHLLFLILGFILGVTLSIQSQSRAGWIAGIFLLKILIILNWKLFKSHILISSVIIITLITSITFTLITDNLVSSRINVAITEIQLWFNNPHIYTSTGTRLSMWKLSGYLFSINPLSGYGDKNFDPSFLTNQTFLAIGSQGGVETIYCCGPHNELLGHILRSGVFGLIAYLCTYGIPLYFFIKSMKHPEVKQASMLGICLIAGMSISGLSSEMLSLKFTFTFYALIISILVGNCLKHER